jgi:glycine/D-amino acid oxidase-like deaminating enzyme
VTGYRGVSFWLDALVTSGRDDLTPRPPLDGDTTADVCIVGGGLTGLWTAWYLHQADPRLQIVVVEREIAGFGASGRNGGWCSALFPRSADAIAREHGRDAALALRRAMRDTVDEVGRAAAEAEIDCDYVKGGTVLYARSAVQERAARDEVAASAAWGDDMTYRDAGPGDAAGSAGVAWTPDCARVQPAALVRGLASGPPTTAWRSAAAAPATTGDRPSPPGTTGSRGCSSTCGGPWWKLFPAVRDAPVTHTWGGPLGVPRDWCASVTWDGHVGTAGGYVGDGLSTTNLAGRTLADLVRGVDSSLTALPWVNHHSPDWEPEPLRFLGANAGLVATDLADREEALTGRPSLAARLMAPLTGGH